MRTILVALVCLQYAEAACSATVSNGIGQYDGSWTEVPDEHFKDCTTMTGVATNGATITRIGDNAFESTMLTGFTVSNTVTSIGDFAFKGVNGFLFNTFTFESSSVLTSIGRDAFNGAFSSDQTNIDNAAQNPMVLPASVVDIGFQAFRDSNRKAIRFADCTGVLPYSVQIGAQVVSDEASFAETSEGKSQVEYPGYTDRGKVYTVCPAENNGPNFPEVEAVEMSSMVSGLVFGGAGVLVLSFLHLMYMSFVL